MNLHVKIQNHTKIHHVHDHERGCITSVKNVNRVHTTKGGILV